jgi:hypothetical protein
MGKDKKTIRELIAEHLATAQFPSNSSIFL